MTEYADGGRGSELLRKPFTGVKWRLMAAASARSGCDDEPGTEGMGTLDTL